MQVAVLCYSAFWSALRDINLRTFLNKTVKISLGTLLVECISEIVSHEQCSFKWTASRESEVSPDDVRMVTVPAVALVPVLPAEVAVAVEHTVVVLPAA